MDVRARIRIDHESDVVIARKRGREVAAEAGLAGCASEELALALTEIARNILDHARYGEVLIGLAVPPDRPAVVVVARDEGPGIPDPSRAVEDGFTTGAGLGLGLPSARRLVDEFGIDSRPGGGTTVTLRKWTGR
jgi:serine/threonine-protein kinase RsbT